MMKAIILAAGVGKRMGDLTKDKPKCLLEINGKSIMRKQVESLNANGITDISAVIGYRSEKVRGASNGLDLKFYTNLRYKESSMLESLFCASEEMDDEFILIYGDVYFEKEVIERLLSDMNDFCISVDNSRKNGFRDEEHFEEYHGKKIRKGPTKVYIAEGLVRKISKTLKPKESSGEYVGIAKFSKRAAKILHDKIKHLIDSDETSKFPSPSHLFRWLIGQGEKINAIFVNGEEYAELDYEHDLDKAKARVKTDIKGILFDAEDVIYFRDEETLKPITDFFKESGYNIRSSEFKEAYAKYRLDAFKGKISKEDHLKKTLEQLNVDYDDAFYEKFLKLFRDAYSRIKITEGMDALFRRLKQKGIKIGILTDTLSSERKKWEWFKEIKLDNFIDCIIGSSETGFTKDSKEAYIIGTKKLGLKLGEVFFVGHQKYEMDGARKAGVKSVSIVEGIGENTYIDNISKIIGLL